MALGPHKIEYEVIQGWEQLPEGYSFMEVAGVACDSQDRVYVFIPRQVSDDRVRQGRPVSQCVGRG